MKNRKRRKSSVPVRAISIQQPYVEEILRGTKRYEYRSRPTHIRERVYLYASRRPGDLARFAKLGKEPGELPTGVVVGAVDIVACKYFPEDDVYGYKLENAKRFRKQRAPRRQPQPCWFYPFKKKAA